MFGWFSMEILLAILAVVAVLGGCCVALWKWREYLIGCFFTGGGAPGGGSSDDDTDRTSGSAPADLPTDVHVSDIGDSGGDAGD